VWVISDLTQSLNPSDFTINFPRATLTMLRIERPYKTLPDGTRIKLLSKMVTAVHSEDGYFYIEEDDRSSGLRVIGDCSGISVGDRVTIVGTIGTLKPDGSTPRERCAYADDISKIGYGGQIAALWMTCRAVGGDEAVGSAGVNHPYGTNNIGLLVRIIVRITRIVDNEHMYVDDGSNLPAPGGNRGVLVRVLSTVGYGVDDLVEVTGVVEGKVPAGWTTNQRYIRVRTTDDVRRILPSVGAEGRFKQIDLREK